MTLALPIAATGAATDPVDYVDTVDAVDELDAMDVEPAAVEGAACTSDPQTITYGSLTACTIDPLGDIDTYRFAGTAGHTVHVQVTRTDGVGIPLLRLYRPDGTLAAAAGYSAASDGFNATLDQTGTYSILVYEYGNDALMPYILSLERVAPPSADARLIQNTDVLSDEINPAGDYDLFYFNICAASTWNVQIVRTGGGNPAFTLFRPDGTVAGSGGSLNVALTQTGPHAILTNELGNDATATYNLTLTCLAGDCSSTCNPEPGCFESGAGATYMKVCVSGDGTLEEFQSPAGYQQLPVADNLEGYAVCSSGLVHGWDAGLDEAGFGEPTVVQPGGTGTLPLTIIRTTTDGVFELTQTYARDITAKDFSVTMTIKNLSASPVEKVRLARYFNGDIDNTGTDDLYDRTLDSVWGAQGPIGHALGLFAKSGTAHTVRMEYATDWDPLVGGSAGLCEVPGITPVVPGDYAGRITYRWASILPGASKSVAILYRRQ